MNNEPVEDKTQKETNMDDLVQKMFEDKKID
jgi:hypothetical protein